jgi:predicted DNA-binding transcriptional regulator AlpA
MPKPANTSRTPSKTPVTEDRSLSVRELAGRYDVSVWTVYKWNQAGTGPPYFKPGGEGSHCRYRLADVHAWEKTRLTGQRRRQAGQRRVA